MTLYLKRQQQLTARCYYNYNCISNNKFTTSSSVSSILSPFPYVRQRGGLLLQLQLQRHQTYCNYKYHYSYCSTGGQQQKQCSLMITNKSKMMMNRSMWMRSIIAIRSTTTSTSSTVQSNTIAKTNNIVADTIDTTTTTNLSSVSSSSSLSSVSSVSSSSSFISNVLSRNNIIKMIGYVLSISTIFTFGFICGQQYNNNGNNDDTNTVSRNNPHQQQKQRILPNGLPRTCCEEHPNNNLNNNNNDSTTKSNVSKEDNNDDTQQQQQQQVIRRRRLTSIQEQLPKRLQRIVGKENVIMVMDTTTTSTTTNENTNTTNATVPTITTITTQMAPYLKGSRIQHNNNQYDTLCIVTPKHLHHVVTIIEACVHANCIIIPQGQNTGLTGGSIPRQYYNTTSNSDSNNDDEFRPVVVLSMKYLNAIFPIDDGDRVVCFAGVGLASLERFLQQYFPDRESHSILGSTFLNPTTAAGIAFGSGGTQCRKGPAYTERALYVKITTNKWDEKNVEIINTLNIDGFEDIDLPKNLTRKQMDTIPYRVDTWGRWIQDGYERDMKYTASSILDSIQKGDNNYPKASDVQYANKLCRRDSSSVSRYNADCSGPDLCRSEGKVIILATVHDTFPKPQQKKTFWISFDSVETALEFRRSVALDDPNDLPISMEYMDRDAFDVVNDAGRILGTFIKYIGTSSTIIRQLWNCKLYIESLPFDIAPLLIDQVLFRLNNYFPSILPKTLMDIGKQRDHHVMLTIGEYGNGNMERIMNRMEQFASKHGTSKVQIIECTNDVAALSAFRFVAAPAFRTWCVGQNLQGYSVDYALPKNGGSAPPLFRKINTNNKTKSSNDGVETETNPIPVKRMRYSHFACNVVHEDLAYGPDVDIDHAKYMLKDVIENECNGKLPAEHGHGTEYIAPSETQERWKRMDPLNLLNPGIGGLSYKYRYKD